MAEERKTPREPEEPPKETSGEYLWRVLKPAGCIFVLLMMIVFLVFCFTYRHDPGEDAPPRTTETAIVTTEPAAAG